MNQFDMENDITEEDASSNGSSRRRNQKTFSWSSVSSSFSNSTLLTSSIEEDAQQITVTEEQQEETMYSYLVLLNEFHQLESITAKEQRLSEILCRAASHDDIQAVQHMMTNERLRPFINIDATDDEDEGSTPLIYASCFGNLEVVTYLLQLGAKVDIQDKLGWTALMWAAANGHYKIVQALLNYSASSDTKSQSGRTIYDLIDSSNEQLLSLLNPLSLNRHIKRKPSTGGKSSTSDENKMHKKQKNITSSIDAEDDLAYCEANLKSVDSFLWDRCLWDQMFVFAEDELEYILDVALVNLKLPMKLRAEIYVPVNIVFLGARYAHYFASRDLLNQLLSKSIQRIDQTLKSNKNDIHILAFWIANLSQLLYYLKKDVGLVVTTAEYQLEISELISEAYTYLVIDSERRLGRILEPSIIEFEQIDGLETVHFADDWHRFFRRNRISTSSNSVPGSPNRRSFGNTFDSVANTNQTTQKPSLQQQQIRASFSPQSMMSLLTSTLYVLQSYDVHPVIVIQAVAQLFHFLSCELFNRILSNRKYLCRSRALQIRMNMTIIDEWIREHHLPTSLTTYFSPVIQLLQLLQCVSQLTDLMDFVTATKSFDLLNPMQVRRVVLNYRYEVSEPKLPEEIEKYTMQIAEDTVKSVQTEKQNDERDSIDSQITSRPNSISSLGNLLLYNMSQKRKQHGRLSYNNNDDTCSVSSLSIQEDKMDSDRDSIIEKKDSQYMLPFSLPTTANMINSGWTTHQQNKDDLKSNDFDNMSLSDKIYYELKQKLVAEREKNIREKSIIPTIPEEWLEKLDYYTEQLQY